MLCVNREVSGKISAMTAFSSVLLKFVNTGTTVVPGLKPKAKEGLYGGAKKPRPSTEGPEWAQYEDTRKIFTPGGAFAQVPVGVKKNRLR